MGFYCTFFSTPPTFKVLDKVSLTSWTFVLFIAHLYVNSVSVSRVQSCQNCNVGCCIHVKSTVWKWLEMVMAINSVLTGCATPWGIICQLKKIKHTNSVSVTAYYSKRCAAVHTVFLRDITAAMLLSQNTLEETADTLVLHNNLPTRI